MRKPSGIGSSCPTHRPAWGWGNTAHLLVGALAHSGRWRGHLAEAETFPHLVLGLDAVSRKLGGLTRSWRFDRMATVASPNTGRITATFAGVAKHYGVQVALCPPRRGNRKGVVEKANHTAAQRFWRTLPDDVTIEQAQTALDDWCRRRSDIRLRSGGTGGKLTVATLAEREPLTPVGAAYPAELAVSRIVSAQALVAFAGNFYSVPPELAGSPVTVIHRLGGDHIDISSGSGSGARGARPPPPRPGRRRCADPHRQSCHRAEHHRDGRCHACPAAPAQATHPTRRSRPRGGRRPDRHPPGRKCRRH